MSKAAYERFMWITRQMETDPEYLELVRRRDQAELLAREILDTLDRDQKDVLLDYFCILQEMETRVMEFAYFAP